jgi:glycerol-3-phosphate dehydrogenase
LLQIIMADDLDLLIIGGGVNGAGIARDAAGRGLSVFLCEKMIWQREHPRDRVN